MSKVYLGCWGLVAAVLVCLLAGGRLAASEEESPAAVLLDTGETPPPMFQLSPDQAPVLWTAEKVGEFHLIDQDGNPVTRETLLGEQWIANFIFTRCTYQCPLTSRRIMELNQELRDDPVRFVTITVDPQHDTVEIMKEFANIWKAEVPRWRFCTGKVDDVMQLIRTGFKVPAWENVGTARLPGMEFAHSDHLIHVSADGTILGRYSSGADSELVTLRKVVQGKIPTPPRHQPAAHDALSKLTQSDPLEKLPEWARKLPATNALLNLLASVLLLQGYTAVKLGRIGLHKRMMLMALLASVAFLGCYLSYHYALHHYAGVRGKPFEGTGMIRSIYYGILVSHVVLAALVPFLAIITIRTGQKAYPDGITPGEAATLVAERKIHKRWAWITFPIWLYVSVTGIIIYWMLYRM